MDLPLSYIINGTTSEPVLANGYPNIRLLQVPLQAFTGGPPVARPLREFPALIPWTRANNVTTASFSAECFLVARGLYDETQRAGGGVVPVGAIQSDWPGASITQMSSPAALATCVNVSHEARTASVEFPGPIPGPGPFSSMWNTMFAPLTVGPLAVGSFAFHQGEADVHGWYIPGFVHTHEHVFSWSVTFAIHARHGTCVSLSLSLALHTPMQTHTHAHARAGTRARSLRSSQTGVLPSRHPTRGLA